MNEGRQLAEGQLRAVAAMPKEELARFVSEPVRTTLSASSGAHYRLRITGYRGSGEYDDDPDLSIAVGVDGTRRHAWQRYRGSVDRFDSPEMAEFEATSEVTSAFLDRLGEALSLGLLALLIVPWFAGIGFLISLLF